MAKHCLQKTPIGDTSPDWHKADIKAALEKVGWSLSRLSRVNKLHRQAAALALRTSWPRMERLIADAIGVTPQEIWPSRYDKSGNSKRAKPGNPYLTRASSQHTNNLSTSAMRRHVKNAGAF